MDVSNQSNWMKDRKSILDKLDEWMRSMFIYKIKRRKKIFRGSIWKIFRRRKKIDQSIPVEEINRFIGLCNIEKESDFREKFPNVRKDIKFL